MNLADILLRLESGCHDFMTAAKALQTKVRTGAQHLPAFFTAGVRLFHNKDVV